MALQLILYGRSYCHLCDDLLRALVPWQTAGSIEVDTVDVDADPALVARYDELVPVLVARQADGTQQEVCHYHLDIAALEALLGESAASSATRQSAGTI